MKKTLTVHVGSQNPVKTAAVEECLREIADFEFIIKGIDVESGVSEQPRSFSETVKGAQNRALKAIDGADLAVGLEDGIFAIPGDDRTFMNICICVITDGQKIHHGCSSAFEYPHEISDLVVGRALDVSEALGAAGYTADENIGSAEGAIGILSKGRLIRKDYTKQAVEAALIHLEDFTGAQE